MALKKVNDNCKVKREKMKIKMEVKKEVIDKQENSICLSF